MNRTDLIKYISSKYQVEPSYFNTQNNECIIFRHSDTRRWFALLILEFPLGKTGIQTTKRIDLLNLHIKQVEIAGWGKEQEVFQTYHMNPDSWQTIPLDGTVKDRSLKRMIEESFISTASEDIRLKKRRSPSNKNPDKNN